MYPHRIRLRGPWEFETTERSGRLALPAPLADVCPSAGEVRLRRRFGRPGRLDPGEVVWLFVEAPAAPLAVWLNGDRLGDCSADAEWDVTGRLDERNELLVVTTSTGAPPWAEVGLLVRRTAYLRDVRVRAEGAVVSATGEVVGRADGPLDLYLVAGRRTAAYASVGATDEGAPFALSGECEEGPPDSAKVELVRGAQAWYTVEVDLAARQA
jgi:hypothetical protein